MKKLFGIAVYDLHYPHYHQKLWKNILRYVKQNRPDVFILGGDNMNFDAVDHWLHEKGLVRQLEGKRILAEYEGFKNDIFNPLEELLPKTCRKIWLNGNHEDWVKLAIDRNPQGEGYWEIENNLHLKDKGWEVYEYGKYVKVGKVLFVHGQYTNQYHSKKTVDVFERNVVYGHTHTFQVYTKITPVENEPHTGMSIPVACELNPDYMRNRPNAWVNGFLTFYIYDTGYFNLYPIVAINGEFVSPCGKFYKGT
ncbi:MAG: metallophosphoesterase [Elusimicrobia bacterium]|nr:metallophosphoesterase [Elusimicrobiota bacterium]